MVVIDCQRFVQRNLFGNNMLYGSGNSNYNCRTDTSHCKILAYSMTNNNGSSITLYTTRKLCEDRRGFLDHLCPKLFFKNVRSQRINHNIESFILSNNAHLYH
jgi:hypothetical protein